MIKRFSSFLEIIFVFVAVGLISLVFFTITGRSVCLFYNITGVPCPSCGMTRAFLYIFEGNFFASLKYHPLFILVLIIPISFLPKSFSDKKRNVLFSSFIVLFLFVWLIRLSLFFPHTPPFIFNDSALIPVIINFFKHV